MSDPTDAGSRINGIGRDETDKRVLAMFFSREPTDYEMRQIHAILRISVNE